MPSEPEASFNLPPTYPQVETYTDDSCEPNPGAGGRGHGLPAWKRVEALPGTTGGFPVCHLKARQI